MRLSKQYPHIQPFGGGLLTIGSAPGAAHAVNDPEVGDFVAPLLDINIDVAQLAVETAFRSDAGGMGLISSLLKSGIG